MDCLYQGVSAALTELRRLGRTLTQRGGDVLAYFQSARHQQRPHRSAQRDALENLPELRPRPPQPDRLHRQITARDRWLSDPAYTLDSDGLIRVLCEKHVEMVASAGPGEGCWFAGCSETTSCY